ncbi:MAG: HAD-IC family P-type ATPase [Microthrixaceae bacterium]|nr:HAD-IC family P-type ATPase [Microthrixaceae bacterium]
MTDTGPTAPSAAIGTAAAASCTPAELADRLATSITEGLGPDAAARRLAEVGPNELLQAEPVPAWKRLLEQFRNVLTYVLLAAAVVSAAVGDLKDPVVILVVLLVNGVFGFFQENRADAAMEALGEMLRLVVRVRRDGELREVPASDLVPGDLVVLDAGDRVPADGRFVATNNLGVEESPLTGESVPVDKHTATIEPEAAGSIGDRFNCGFMNTTVVRGRGELLVTATGMSTEVGRLAGMLAAAPKQLTPLQRQLDALGRRLAAIAVVAVLVVFGLALLQGEDFNTAMLESVALAVAAIPEGLPAVVTVTLAIGVSRMAEHNAIVKRLASVETLGSTTAICSDKTGTLTLNQMTATTVVTGAGRHDVSGLGYERSGALDRSPDAEDFPDAEGESTAGGIVERAVALAALCNDAEVRFAEPGSAPEIVGDPTEVALVVLAEKAGLDVAGLRSSRPRRAELPFDSTTKFMATLHDSPDDPGQSELVVKGAPDVVLQRCSTVALDGARVDLDGEVEARVALENAALGEAGLRVLAVASRALPVRAAEFEADLASEVTDLELDCLVGILDPARPEAVAAIARCHDAGIDVRMITGDHATTAGAIAAELGIVGDVITGPEIEAMDDRQLAGVIESVGVCARVSPEHKVRVVAALQANGEVVAMTGDGVNDAPALKNADIGVAMGITGTEVTKEAGDMVLADDNFATIVSAVRRGRAIYDNILNFVRFQLTTNMAAIGSILFGRLLGLPTPFTAIQVLFVNIIADGPPAVSLGIDPPKPGLMDRPPRDPGAPILSGRRLVRIMLGATVMTVATLLVLVLARDAFDQSVALTMAFTTFVLLQLANALVVRVDSGSVISSHSLTNGYLWLALLSVAGVQVLVVQAPFAQDIFDTVGLSATQWAICVAVALGYVVIDEVASFVQRRLGGPETPAPLRRTTGLRARI